MKTRKAIYKVDVLGDAREHLRALLASGTASAYDIECAKDALRCAEDAYSCDMGMDN